MSNEKCICTFTQKMVGDGCHVCNSDFVKGLYSESMGVNTKPSKKIDIAGYWVLVDPNMPDWMFEKLKMAIVIHDVQIITKNQNHKNPNKNAVK